MSDQHKSIKNAVEAVLSNAAHGLCYYHLSNNMASCGAHVGVIIKDAAYCYRDEAFQKNLSVLEILSKEGAHKRLSSIGVERWSGSQCPARRFSFMTSNSAESLIARFLWARRLPICSLLEVYRTVIEKWFDERRAAAKSRNHVLTEEAMKKLSKAIEHGRHLTVHGTTTHLYKVEEENMSFLVDL